jgi:hypothetical protein
MILIIDINNIEKQINRYIVQLFKFFGIFVYLLKIKNFNFLYYII